MISKNSSTHLFIAFLIVLVSIAGLVLQKRPQSDLPTYREKYVALKQSYIDLARSQSHILELLLRNCPDLQKLMPEYKDLGEAEFSKTIRHQIGELKLQAKYLETEK